MLAAVIGRLELRAGLRGALRWFPASGLYRVGPRVRNVEALPTDGRSLFLRCYLNQGKRHPRQLEGHRTTTVLQRVGFFQARQQKKSYRIFYHLAIEGLLSPQE